MGPPIDMIINMLAGKRHRRHTDACGLRQSAIVGVVVCLTGVGVAPAEQITTSDGFTISANGGADTMTLDGFDTSLGELNSVSYQMDVPVIVTVGTTFNPDPVTAAPTPYAFTFDAEHNINGSPGGFVDTGEWFGSRAALGGGQDVVLANGFSVSATIDPDAGRVGLTSPSGYSVPPTQIAGTLEDFEDQPIALTSSFLMNPTPIDGPPVFVDTVTFSGVVSLTYDYTPIPEPATLTLLGLGGLLLRRRHRSQV